MQVGHRYQRGDTDELIRKDPGETYASSCGAKTAEEKRSLYEQSLAEDCTYTDPLTQRRGHDELLAYMK